MKLACPFSLSAMLAIALVVSCSGDDDDSDTSKLSITVTPTTTSLARGATTSITITLARHAAEGAVVSLAATDLPTGVTAAFDATSTTGDTATLTLTATMDAALGGANVTITAMANAVAPATATLSLTVTEPLPTTISGTLVNSYGIPYANAIVHVYGDGATTAVDATTNADGTFTALNVQPPYDVVAVIPAGNRVFLGLTSATPLLGVIFDTDLPNQTVCGLAPQTPLG